MTRNDSSPADDPRDPSNPSDPYRPPTGLDAEVPPRTPGRCLTFAATSLGGFLGGALGLLGGWALLIGPNPGPGFHITFPFVLGGGAVLALLGGSAGYLLSRRLRGASTPALSWSLAGVTLAGGGLIFLWLSHTAGPFLLGPHVSRQRADGTYSYSTRHYDREGGGLLTLAGLGLLVGGWARRRRN